MSVEDVRVLMRARKLPDDYAAQFIAAARGNRWWSNSIGCDVLQCAVYIVFDFELCRVYTM